MRDSWDAGGLEASLASQIARALSEKGIKIGVVNVRVYRPFVEEEFLEVLPTSVQNIAVLGQVLDQAAVADETEHSNLYSDVLAALTFVRKPLTHTPPPVSDPRLHANWIANLKRSSPTL